MGPIRAWQTRSRVFLSDLAALHETFPHRLKGKTRYAITLIQVRLLVLRQRGMAGRVPSISPPRPSAAPGGGLGWV